MDTEHSPDSRRVLGTGPGRAFIGATPDRRAASLISDANCERPASPRWPGWAETAYPEEWDDRAVAEELLLLTH